MAETGTVFNEILEIRVDTAKFAQDMDSLVQIYAEKLQQMPKLGALDSSQLNATINRISDSLDHMSQQFGEKMGAVANQIVEQLDQVAEHIDQNAAKVQQSLAQAQSSTQGTAKATQQVSNNMSGWQRFTSQFVGKVHEMRDSFGGLLAQVTAYVVLWKIINGALEFALDLLKSLPEAVAAGFEYLNKVEQQATDLQGVIASNIKYSKDLGENFKIAGEQAEAVVKQLHNIGIRDALDPTQLEDAFKALVSGGVAPFAKDMNDVVGLTELFALAMKASGKSVAGTRSLISEIPKLLDGTISKHSKILQVLHLNKDQWEQIRQAAMKHGDLLGELSKRLEPYLSVVQQAQMHQDVILGQLDQMKTRMEGAVALPLWKELGDILAKVRDWLLQHQRLIALAAASIGNLVKGSVDFLITVVKIAGALLPWKGILIDALGVLYLMIQGANVLLTIFKGAGSDFADLLNTVFNPDNWTKGFSGFEKKWDEFQKRSEQRHTDITKKVIEEGKQIDDAIHGTSTSQAAQEASKLKELLNLKFLGGNGPTDKGASGKGIAQAIRREFEAAIQAAKTEQQKLANVIDEGEKHRTLSIEQGEQERIAGFKKEQSAVVAAAFKAYEEIQKSGLDDKHKSALLSSIGSGVQVAMRQIGKAITTAQDKIGTDQLAILKVKHDEAYKLESDHQKSLLELQKLYASEGYKTATQAAQDEIDAQNAAFQTALAKAQQDKADAGKNNLLLSQAQAQIDQLIANHQNQQVINAEKLEQAHRKDVLAMEQMLELTKQIDASNAQAALDRARKFGALSPSQDRNAQIRADQQGLGSAAQAQYDALQNYLTALRDNLNPATQHSALEMEQLRDKLIEASRAVTGFKDKLTLETPSFRNAGRSASEKLFGFDIAGALNPKDANGTPIALTGMQKLKVAAEAAAGALQNLPGIIGQIQQGYKQGGTFGAIGAGITAFSGALSAIPVIGPFMGAIGSAFSIIGGLFTAAARHIADQIKKEIKQINDNYQNGADTLIQTITALQQERADAIARLSGKRGGQDQLNQILPSLNNEIASLQKQAADVRKQFELSVQALAQGGDVLSQWYQSWIDINKQVEDYLNAGGSKVIAQQMLTLQHTQLLKQYKDDLRDADLQAIQDAIQLNQLQQQKVDLINQEKATEFGILTADSLQKRTSQAVQTASKLAQQRKQFNSDLQNLDQQINATQQKVNLESKIFDINLSIADLQNKQNQLNLQALQEQIDGYKQMQKLLSSGFNVGNFFPYGGAFNPGYVPGITAAPTVSIVNHFPTTTNPQMIAIAIRRQLQDITNPRLRMGMNRF